MTPYTTTKNGDLTPNRAWVMKTAWAHVARVNQGSKVIRRALKWAWEEAHRAVLVQRAMVAWQASVAKLAAMGPDALRMMNMNIENKSRLSANDVQTQGQIRQAIYIAEKAQ
jgi:hypothetical protein